jgi:hypothetical protein
LGGIESGSKEGENTLSAPSNMVKNLVQVAQPRFQRANLTRYCGPALF